MPKKIINAVIGVCYEGDKTLYVKRSKHMDNYPDTWSLFSIQFEPKSLSDYLDLTAVQALMMQMSEQRLGGVAVKIFQYISSTTCVKNSINAIVNLHLYRIEFMDKLILNPAYYSELSWMTPSQYLEKRGEGVCGSCMRMWSDYSMKTGLSDIRFAPMIEDDNQFE